MKIDDVIKKLQHVREKHGNLDLLIENDYNTSIPHIIDDIEYTKLKLLEHEDFSEHVKMPENHEYLKVTLRDWNFGKLPKKIRHYVVKIHHSHQQYASIDKIFRDRDKAEAHCKRMNARKPATFSNYFVSVEDHYGSLI